MTTNTEIQRADPADFPAWIELAREVEPLFGPMVGEPGFHAALEGHIARGTAYCVRADDGGPGAPLLGGILLSVHKLDAHIDWLAVAQRARRHGVGRLLVAHALSLCPPGASVSVVTFGPDNPEGQAARRLYEAFGFVASEMSNPGPEGESRQVFRLEART